MARPTVCYRDCNRCHVVTRDVTTATESTSDDCNGPTVTSDFSLRYETVTSDFSLRDQRL